MPEERERPITELQQPRRQGLGGLRLE
jgi:hypothetical protein